MNFFLQVILESLNVQLRDLVGGESEWYYVGQHEQSLHMEKNTTSILHLAKKAADVHRTAHSESDSILINIGLKSFEKLERGNDLKGTNSRSLHGRQYADAAFLLAVAGVPGPQKLYFALADGCERELKRFGHKLSCRPADILTMVERLAAAGVPTSHSVYSTAACILLSRGALSDQSLDEIWSPFSTRPLLWLWIYSAKNRWTLPTKLGLQGEVNLRNVFENSRLPIVVDLACGYGTSLLGLSIRGDKNVNYLGCDINPQGLAYARGMSQRTSCSSRCARNVAFLRIGADKLLDSLLEDRSLHISTILVQFPTPFQLKSEDNALNVEVSPSNNEANVGFGNTDLPRSKGFLFSPELVSKVSELLQRNGGTLALQSNAEGNF